MLGMMLGAVFWGALADLQGRRVAFRATLGATAVFGLGSSVASVGALVYADRPREPTGCSWAGSFSILRLGLFFLGFNVGGSMPSACLRRPCCARANVSLTEVPSSDSRRDDSSRELAA
jgi:MFS family permease